MKKQLNILFKNHVEILLFFVCLLVLKNFQESILQIDSFNYISKSKFDFFSFNFWFSPRPVGFPLIIKIFGVDFLFCFFQTALYFLSWIFFYRTLKVVNPKIHKDPLLSIIILMVSFLNTPFDDLIFNIMTEPMNFSLILLIISCLFRLTIQFDNKIFSLFLFCLCYFSLLKDANNVMIPFFILSAFLISFPKKQLFVLALVMSMFLFYSWKGINNQDLGMYQRWVFPMFNNFGQRVLTHKDWEKFSDREHIPKSERGKLLELKGKWSSSDTHKFYRSLELSDFRFWFLKHGKTSYLRFLIGYPTDTVKIIVSGFKETYLDLLYFYEKETINTIKIMVLGPKETSYKVRVSGFKGFPGIGYYCFYIVFLFWILLKIFFTSWERLNTFRSFVLLFFSLFIMSFVVSSIYIIGDAMEIFRHTLPCVLVFFSSFLGLGVTLDKSSKGSLKTLSHQVFCFIKGYYGKSR